MTEIVVATHLHPDRARAIVPGHFEALEAGARHRGMRTVTLPYRQPERFAAALDRAPRGAWLYFNGGVAGAPIMHALAEAAHTHGLRLLNSPDENERLMRFERFYPLVCDLTARSVIADGPAQALAALELLELPVFVKGSIISRKDHGWDACVARDRDELAQICAAHRGTVVIRELLDLRRSGQVHGDFPTAREYRVYLRDERVLGHGSFWPGPDPFGALRGAELADALDLARHAARRVRSPLACVDVAQLADMSWKLIELGDPQHTGVAHMPRELFWTQLTATLAVD